jgi:hypothetical protein
LTGRTPGHNLQSGPRPRHHATQESHVEAREATAQAASGPAGFGRPGPDARSPVRPSPQEGVVSAEQFHDVRSPVASCSSYRDTAHPTPLLRPRSQTNLRNGRSVVRVNDRGLRRHPTPTSPAPLRRHSACCVAGSPAPGSRSSVPLRPSIDVIQSIDWINRPAAGTLPSTLGEPSEGAEAMNRDLLKTASFAVLHFGVVSSTYALTDRWRPRPAWAAHRTGHREWSRSIPRARVAQGDGNASREQCPAMCCGFSAMNDARPERASASPRQSHCLRVASSARPQPSGPGSVARQRRRQRRDAADVVPWLRNFRECEPGRRPAWSACTRGVPHPGTRTVAVTHRPPLTHRADGHLAGAAGPRLSLITAWR